MKDDSTSGGLRVSIEAGAPARARERAIEVDVGAGVPVALDALRRILGALGALAPDVIARGRDLHAPEWNVLFPEAAVPGRDLFELADAPNQRRLFRESEQTFRVLNVGAHLMIDALRELERPLVLRNVGAADLVSLRGLMHAVQCSRLTSVTQQLVLCDWNVRAQHASPLFAATREEQLEQLRIRMGAEILGSADGVTVTAPTQTSSLEARYLACALDQGASVASRVAASLLAIRACFFSTSYEGAMLAAGTAQALLDRSGDLGEGDLRDAWDALDDASLDIPMVEMDRSSLGDTDQIRALLHLHLGILRVFTGHVTEGLDAFARGLERTIAPELAADLRLYRAVTTTKTLGKIPEARREIACGLALLEGRSRALASTPRAWLHNLMALTFVREKNLREAQREEELALACIDDMPGPSAAHLKTNLVSNFSVLYEAKGDLPMATRIWQSFESLNAKLGSDAADKVYLNRLGALQSESGDAAAALASYRGAFDKAQATGDVFHSETIAGAMARVLLDRGGREDRAQAVFWYETAAESARACGDCPQLARNLAGATIAASGADFGAARGALAADTSYACEAASLSRALATDDASAVLGELPRAKSKLSRPFTLVNL